MITNPATGYARRGKRSGSGAEPQGRVGRGRSGCRALAFSAPGPGRRAQNAGARQLRGAVTNLDESLLCHRAGAPHAAVVSLAPAFEAVLVGMVVVHEDELRAGGRWPAQPVFLHLTELPELARRAGWLPELVTSEVIEFLNKVRTMAAHPGACVRAVRQLPELDLADPAGYAAVYDVVVRASRALF